MTDGPPNSVSEMIQTVFFLPTTTNNFDTQHPMAPTSPNVELICWSSSHLVINLPQTFIWTREWCTFLHPIPVHSTGVSPCSSGCYREDETIDCRLGCGLCPVVCDSVLHIPSRGWNSSCCLIIIYIIIIVTVGVLWDWIGRLLLPPPPSSLDRHWVHDQPREIKRQILQYVSLRGLLSCIRIRILAWPDELWTDTHTYFNEHRFHGRRRRDHHHRHHLSSDWQRCIRSKITK